MDIKPYMKAIGYSRDNTRHIIVEQGEKLWLALASQAASATFTASSSQPTGLLEINAVIDGQPAPYDYTASEAQVEIKTSAGTMKITIDRAANALRFEGQGFALRLDGKTSPQNATSLNTPDGVELTIGGGNYFFKPVKGAVSFDDSWILNQFHSTTPVLDLAPDGGAFEMIAYLLPAETEPPVITTTFDESASENAADFKAFCDNLVDTPDEWSALREKIAYTMWVGTNAPMLVANKRLSGGADSWQLAVASMAYKDVKTAMRMITAAPPAAPPLHGLAILRLLDDGIFQNLGRDEIYKLYEPVGNLARFWAADRSAVIQNLYFCAYRYETSLRAPATFGAGEPAASPDVNAYMVLLCEAMSRMADHVYDGGEVPKWRIRASATLGALLGNLWNGEDFVGMNIYTNEQTEPDALLSLMPLLLGKRLPTDIAAKLAARVTEETIASLLGLTLVFGLKYAGFDEQARSLTAAALKKAQSGGIEDPFYGAALLALANKTL